MYLSIVVVLKQSKKNVNKNLKVRFRANSLHWRITCNTRPQIFQKQFRETTNKGMKKIHYPTRLQKQKKTFNNTIVRWSQ